MSSVENYHENTEEKIEESVVEENVVEESVVEEKVEENVAEENVVEKKVVEEKVECGNCDHNTIYFCPKPIQCPFMQQKNILLLTICLIFIGIFLLVLFPDTPYIGLVTMILGGCICMGCSSSIKIFEIVAIGCGLFCIINGWFMAGIFLLYASSVFKNIF